MKLFGGASGARTAGGRAAAVKAAVPKQRNPLKALAIALAVILVLEVCYFICIFSKNSFIARWRNIYIATAMETMSHQWLATAIIPAPIIEEVMQANAAAMDNQAGLTSQWQKEETPAAEEPPAGTTDPENI